ncbi:hypothetical protein EVAR_77995_1 [Eumeta japonica]|uniref:Uncharacterized protein n=1 Tax=Eumeta variegata TaxID=151549 RepID=A0A4C1T105_EUMVA|nr:hypothetical protein EVAR_77995_1 [Eumeta japonica]
MPSALNNSTTFLPLIYVIVPHSGNTISTILMDGVELAMHVVKDGNENKTILSKNKLRESAIFERSENVTECDIVGRGCVRLLSLFYSDASADGVEERSLAPRSRSHARLRRNATMSHTFSYVQPAFIDL